MKHLIDILAATITFIFLIPVFLIIILLIKLTMPGPVLFTQTRIGYKGLPFRIFKFRTMKVNNSNISITLSDDERITSFGRLLRKSKLDELPQLLNIFKGEMSFVGPRPDVPGYSDKLTGNDRLIWSLKPGLTGIDSITYPFEEEMLATVDDPVSFYNEVIWPAKVKLNVWYALNKDFFLDLKIIVNTVSLLLFNKHWVKIVL